MKARPGKTHSESDLHGVLMSTSLMRSVTLVLAAWAYTKPAEQQQRHKAQAVGISNSPLSGSKSQDMPSTGCTPAAVTLTWKTLLDSVRNTSRQVASVPASHLQLCTLLGIDAKLLLTLTGFFRVPPARYLIPDQGSRVVSAGLVDIWWNVLAVYASGVARQSLVVAEVCSAAAA